RSSPGGVGVDCRRTSAWPTRALAISACPDQLRLASQTRRPSERTWLKQGKTEPTADSTLPRSSLFLPAGEPAGRRGPARAAAPTLPSTRRPASRRACRRTRPRRAAGKAAPGPPVSPRGYSLCAWQRAERSGPTLTCPIQRSGSLSSRTCLPSCVRCPMATCGPREPPCVRIFD
uniref:Uncharacterized protein n=2 Tax=Tetraodon nigroviridis TaxID=99883 RepID=H3C2N8_TETNG